MAKLNLKGASLFVSCKLLQLLVFVAAAAVAVWGTVVRGWLASASFSLLFGSAKLKRKSLPDVNSADFFTKLDFVFVSVAAVNLICLDAKEKKTL